MNKYKFTFLILSASLFLNLLSVYDFDVQAFSPWEIDKITGNYAQDFTTKDLSGNKVSLSSFKGKPILLNIWATWCPYCREERPQLDYLYKEYRGSGLVIIAVSVDKSPEKVRRYLNDIPAEYVVLIDEEGAVARLYGVYALPTSFLIDRHGKVRYKFMGPKMWTSNSFKILIEELFR